MKKDFITINDQQYRVEINMNTVEDWERRSGKKLGQFEIEAAKSAKTGGVVTRVMLLWLFCAIIEGEEIEGREFEPDFLEFKRMISPSIMSFFALIFIKQYIGESAASSGGPACPPVKKKSPIRSAFHSFGRWHWAKWVFVSLILAFVAWFIFGMRSGV